MLSPVCANVGTSRNAFRHEDKNSRTTGGMEVATDLKSRSSLARARRRSGLALLTVEVPLVELTEALVAKQFLNPMTDDKAAVVAALARMLEGFILENTK